MDRITLYVQMMDWILKTLIPILTIVLPIITYLHMQRKNDMKGKADKDMVDKKFEDVEKEISKKVDLNAYKTKMESIDKDTAEIKKDRIRMENNISTDLKYIRERIDQVADRT